MEGRYFEAEAVRAAAKGAWDSVLGKAGVRTELLTGKHGPCPGCGGRDRFRFDDREGTGSFICSQGTGEILAGDGIDLLAHSLGIEWKEAIQVLGEQLDLPGRAVTGQAKPKPTPVIEAAPVAERPRGVLAFDPEKLRAVFKRHLETSREWFQERSPVAPGTVAGPEDFLKRVYSGDEKVLIFTNYFSQGQFIFWPKSGVFRLGEEQGVRAKRVEAIPRDNPEGVWFLNQPISGEWHPNPRGKADAKGGLPWSRRSQESITDWRFLVLESDEAEEGLWLNFLAQLPLPIVAIYTSGGRSVHALCRLDVHSKADFDHLRRLILPLFTRLGADGGALTGVRLTRLPGCRRKAVVCQSCQVRTTAKANPFKCKKCGNWVRPERAFWAEQKLIYLNPKPEPGGVPIYAGGNLMTI